jgi:SAM-dependent methyltransferase
MTDYTLAISEDEVARYRWMADRALVLEATELDVAGIAAGAVVADVGCGPAAMSVELAARVGPTGRVIGIERDEQALATAHALVAQSGATNVELRAGDAADTGVEAGSVDVVMMRHVLAHNGGHEQAIVDHLATLPRPGGCVYLVDVDLTGVRTVGEDPDLDDLHDTYARFHAARGNDPQIGLRLGRLLENAGLELVSFTGHYSVVEFPSEVRMPAFAARESMIAEGVVTAEHFERWDAAVGRSGAAAQRPMHFLPFFVAVGRKPAQQGGTR